MAQKLGPVYFGHPGKVDGEGRKETVYLGTLFENRFSPDDPRKELSLSILRGEKWVRASSITYGTGDDAFTIEIPDGAFIKAKIRPDGGFSPGGQQKPERF